MPDDLVRFQLRVGATETLGVLSNYEAGGTAKQPASAVVSLYDDTEPIEGTVDSATAGTLADADLTYAADYLNWLPLEVNNGTQTELTQITDYSVGVLSFGTLSWTPPVGAIYRVLGTPVLAETAATATGTGATFDVDPTAATSRPRKLKGSMVFTYSASDIAVCALEVDVALSSIGR